MPHILPEIICHGEIEGEALHANKKMQNHEENTK